MFLRFHHKGFMRQLLNMVFANFDLFYETYFLSGA